MLTQIINGQILTPQGWLKDGSVLISDGKILEATWLLSAPRWWMPRVCISFPVS